MSTAHTHHAHRHLTSLATPGLADLRDCSWTAQALTGAFVFCADLARAINPVPAGMVSTSNPEPLHWTMLDGAPLKATGASTSASSSVHVTRCLLPMQTVDFFAASSYGAATVAAGDVSVNMLAAKIDVSGRHVLVVGRVLRSYGLVLMGFCNVFSVSGQTKPSTTQRHHVVAEEAQHIMHTLTRCL